MVQRKTFHVLRRKGHWAVQREGEAASIHPTKKQALEQARALLSASESGQIAIHQGDGNIIQVVTKGLPQIQTPPTRSRLSSKKIAAAVNKLLMEKLAANQG